MQRWPNGRLVVLTVVLASAFSSPTIHGDEIKKLLASDAALGDAFGRAVAIDGDTVLVGADSSGAGTGTGFAYLFRRDEGGSNAWGEVKKLIAADGSSGDFIGNSVAISGDTAVLGAPVQAGALGAVYIFQRDRGGPDNWGEVLKLTASDGTAADSFGAEVAISGDTVAVGSPFHDGSANNSGAVYLFERNEGGVDQWGEVEKLTASDAAENDIFGVKIALDGDTLVVGARGRDSSTGGVYVFERDLGGIGNWGERTTLTASDAAPGDQFGAVWIHGDTLVVGARFNSDDGERSGSAYVFDRDEGGADQWGEVDKLTASDAAANDWFGEDVAVDGHTISVAAAMDENNDGTGSAYVFQRNPVGSNPWQEVEKLLASDGEDNDFFGNAVAVDGDRVVVGSLFDDDACPANPDCNSGSAYIFLITIFSDGFESGDTNAWSSAIP